MNRGLQKRVLDTIARHSMMRPGDRIGVGVSGGADSTALLRLLLELKAELGIVVVALHFHHQLRGVEADLDEQFVRDLAAKWDVAFIAGRADVAAEARHGKSNLEETARRLRYRFFESAATAHALNRAAVAHSVDDQAETVLSHILRGTGLAGLAGIYPVSGRIVRPLLEIGREELRRYLSALGQDWREDASNQDTSRVRARIRHRLLPLLRNEFDPAAAVRVARLAAHARGDEAFWRWLEDDRFAVLTTLEPAGTISLAVADLLDPLGQPGLMPPDGPARSNRSAEPAMALAHRLVRRICFDLRGDRRQLTARHIQAVLDLATKSQSGAHAELPGVAVERSFDRLIFRRVSSPADSEKKTGTGEGSRQQSRQFEHPIARPTPSQPCHIVVPEIGRTFELKVIDWPRSSRETTQVPVTLDFDRLRWPLILRNWRAGDSYRPWGRKRTQKLKRLFLEARVPANLRAEWPVVTSGEQLVWALGYPVANEFAPQTGTRTGLVITEEKFEDQGWKSL